MIPPKDYKNFKDASLLEASLSSNENRSPLTAPKPKVPVLGGLITPLDLGATVRLLIEMCRGKASGYVCIANVHTTTLALRDAQFREALDGAAAVVADGVPVLWRVRTAGYIDIGRVHGVDLVEATCQAGIDQGLRHGFFGGLEDGAEEMVCRLKQRYPALQVAGVWNPGVIQQGQLSPAHVIAAINASECDVLWVGLGAPKQEIWMAQHRSRLTAPVLVAVGQAFDIIAGRALRAPDWMGSHGIEWFYRLAHDPRRLWKRYVIYNSLFLWYLFLERLGVKLGRDSSEQLH